VLALSFALTVLGGCSGRDDSGTPDDSGTSPTETIGTITKNGITVWLDPKVKSMVWVQWVQAADAMAHVEYSFDDGVWLSSPTEPAPSGTNKRILVGIPFDTLTQVRLVADGASDIEGPSPRTGPNPRFDDRDLPKAALLEADEGQWYSSGKYLITSINDHDGGWRGGTYYTIVLDRQGRTVWAHAAPDTHWTLYVTIDPITRDHFVWDESTKWSDFGDDGDSSLLHRWYLDKEIATIPAKGLHHEWVELPDGTLAWGSQSPDHSTTEALVELAPGAEDPVPIWTCDGSWPGFTGVSCESNGLYYQASTNTYLYSFYTNNSLVEVDRVTGSSLWWAGAVQGGNTFDPTDSQFSWQHGVSYTPTGTLLVSTKSSVGGAGITTYVREYDVDHSDDTLHEVWHCDSGVFASTNGDAWRLPNDNTLHVIGAAGQIKEYLPDCTVVWHLDFGDDFLLGRGEFIDDLYSLVSPSGVGTAP
jgi:hypothetical protein